MKKYLGSVFRDLGTYNLARKIFTDLFDKAHLAV